MSLATANPMANSLLSWLFGEWGCSRCERMHRRAQAAESAAAKVVRQNDHERLWLTVASLKRYCENQRRLKRLWLQRYRDAKALHDSGVERKDGQ
jgi:hypothetical protein